MQIKQVHDLVYQKIDKKYYITNINRREVVVLNEFGFKILEISENKTVDELCNLILSKYKVCREDITIFLKDLSLNGLIEYIE